MQEKATIGLDLGTGNCCVASVQNGIATVLPNSLGKKTTPSCVAFNESRSLVGYSAKEQASVNPTNTIHSIKSILGRTSKDSVTQNYNKFSSCNVVRDHGMPKIEVENRQRTLRQHPELIAAIQILDMKQQAERQVGEVGGAVVSVPAYFGNSQREAIVAACQIAGLELLDLISEPTATALTYRENRGSISGQETILVFDMGAAKLDVSVIRVSEQEVRVLAVCGDDALGGDILDQCLMKLLDDKFFAAHGKRLLTNPRSRMRLKMASEEMKLKLTHLSYWKTLIDGILGDMNLDVHITRKEFESLFSSEFSDKFSRILNSVLSNAKLSKEQIDQVLVVGGCTRVPFIQSSLRKYFDGKTLNKTVNADECVATGAALLANDIRHGAKIQEAGVIEMIPDPSSMVRSQFRQYMELKSDIKFEIETTNEFNNGEEERKKYTYTMGSFGVFKEEVLYVKPFDKNKNSHGKNSQHSVVSSGKDELRTLEKHRKNIEAAETASNDLEEYCYRFQRELESEDYSNHDLEVKNCIDKVLEWIDDQEEHDLNEYEERKNRLSQLWDQMKLEFEKSKAASEKANASSRSKTSGGMAKATNQNAGLKDGSRGPKRVGSQEVKDADAKEKVDEVDQSKNITLDSTNKSEGSQAESKNAVNLQGKRGDTSGCLEPAKRTDSPGKSDETCESPSSESLLESVSSCPWFDSHDNVGEQSRIEAESTEVGIKKDISEMKTHISEIKKKFSEVKKDISEIKTSLQTMEKSNADTNTKIAVVEAKVNEINMELCSVVDSMLHADDDTVAYGDHDLISSHSLTASMVSADSAIEDPPEHPLSSVPHTQVPAGDGGGRRKREGEVNTGVSSVGSKNVTKTNKETKTERVNKNVKEKKAERVPDKNGKEKEAVNVLDKNSKGTKAESSPEKNSKGTKAESSPEKNSKGKTAESVPEKNSKGKIPESVPEKNSKGKTPESVLEKNSKGKTPENVPENSKGKIPESVPEKNSKGKTPESVLEKNSKGKTPENVPEKNSKGKIPESVIEKNSKGKTPENVPDKNSTGKTPENVPDKNGKGKTAQNVPDKSSKGKTAQNVPDKSSKGKTAQNVPDKNSTGKTPEDVPDKNSKGKTAQNVPDKNSTGKTAQNVPDKSSKGKTAQNVPDKNSTGKTAQNVPDKSSKGKTAQNVPDKNGKGKTAQNVPDKNSKGKTAQNVPDKNGKGKTAENVIDKNGKGRKPDNLLDKNTTSKVSSPGRQSVPPNRVQDNSPSPRKSAVKGGSASGPSKQSRSGGGRHGSGAAASGHGGSPQRPAPVDNPEDNDATLRPEDFKFTPVRNCVRVIWEWVRIYFECIRTYFGLGQRTSIRDVRESLERRAKSRQKNKKKKQRGRGGRVGKEFSDDETEDDDDETNQNRGLFRRMCSIQ